MKITLISPYPDITAFGMRTISAYLKQYGYDTQLIFLPDPYGDGLIFGVERYNDKALDDLIPLCKDSDIIGITLMTNFYDGAVQITKKLKSGLDKPIIWGGVHATIRPEESLEYADIVCVGDGEDALLELVGRIEKREPYHDVKNIWVKVNGSVVRNSPRNLPHNLDVYPMPDYSLTDHHILFEGRIQPLTYDLMRFYLERGSVSGHLKKIGYQTMTGRGCPHKCTYCINDTLKTMYDNDNYLRWRSTDHVINELLWVKENLPYVGFIWISDDAFFARNKKNLEEFCIKYKEKIGLPFTCLGSPTTISEEKMDLLVDAGLFYIQMGVETGSSRIQEIFNRKHMNNEKLIKAFNIINKYKDKMFPPSYDFILDVPYETDKDKIETLRLISDIPKPFKLQPFSLVLSPGTKLYDMAKADGYIGDEKKEIYSKTWAMRDLSYYNLLITLAQGGRFPSSLLKLLISRPATMTLGSKLMKPFFKYFYLALKRLNHSAKRLVQLK